MEYLYHNCKWSREELMTIPIMADDAKSSCLIYSYEDNPDVIYLGNLYVCPEVRKDGRGRDLLHFCFDLARRQGFKSMMLRVESHSWIMKWYMREGFEFHDLDESEPDVYVWLVKPI